MKKIALLTFFIIILGACDKNPKVGKGMEILAYCWKAEKNIDYSKPYTEIKADIDCVVDRFDECINKYPQWSAIYASKRLFLRMLYGKDVIDKTFFEREYQKVFDAYLARNKLDNDVQSCFQYAMFKKFQGDNEASLEILKMVYNPDWEYTFSDNVPTKDVINFIAGNLLGQIDKNQFKGTIYEQFFELNDENDIFNLL